MLGGRSGRIELVKHPSVLRRSWFRTFLTWYLLCALSSVRGSAVAKIVGNNVKKLQKFASTVKMWVFEENINGRKLSDIINKEHENVKYLPGHKLPDNVVAIPNLNDAVADADLLVFVIPHQFIHKVCDEMTGRVPKKALGITLIKGIDEGPGGLRLISDIIREKMGIDISVLMGANLANEVAAEKFCETTIGSKILENGLLFKELLQTPNFRITVVDDAETVELCGALKNIVAVGAGFCDGLCCGDNTKAAVIRLGLMEMIAFARIFCKGQVSTATFLESCGVADLITTCYGGRNRRVAEAVVKTGKSIEELEKEMLNGQKLQGPRTSAEVHRILKQKGMLEKFPLFTAVYQICYEGRPVGEIITCLQSHPEHIKNQSGC
ncbi:glycerol-3-phosphate dehydrogenase 1-like protein isoform X1 [Chiroxiphia lanceolata]|uniref:glycerol-3-phosphate dehydrogenase 1-like protein isoform X1 n=1 Tax=Chiroxiphia lanceolata TaxID=296741 RepID=UPI0013CF0D8D|nr:glycerol-3-phosphate dehydrogenase 1-like protein isoform X1 [Chiroxiphia lanceolata]